ncbi:hypothetical protein [Lentzea sp. NPDC092896]|uniref:hypothetical protein n=1 Tax=Lentzea sp. NPDC092896 TaxID=3364127 RepID=UPI0037FCB302
MVAGGWRLTMGVAVLVTGGLIAPAAVQAEEGCRWVMTNLPVPAGQYSLGPLGGDGDWLTSTSGLGTVVVWHQEVPRTVTFPADRAAFDINRNGVLLSAGEDGLWRGEEKLEELPGRSSTVHSINTAGDVVGTSGGALVMWPAGSATPHVLEGTDDGEWWLGGIDDAGNVFGGFRREAPQRYYVWNREGARTELPPLQGHYQAFATSIRDGRVYGASAVKGDYLGTSVEWNLRGEIVRTMPGRAVLASNDAGDQLSYWESGIGVRRANGRFDPLPNGVAFPSVLSESGDVFGGRYWEGPVKLRCA